ncbi:MAG: hypothetical protein V8R91_06670 [Butyricimonas faecihominis]
MQTLRLDGNQLSGQSDLSQFSPNLTDVYLSNNKLEGNLNGISKL